MYNASCQVEELYKICLTSSLACTRFLLMQGLAFRGHDELASSLNKGNFLELISWLKDKIKEVMNAFDHALNNVLKEALLSLLDHHGLSISKIRGQGYDGASSMRGEFNSLQKRFWILIHMPIMFIVLHINFNLW
jgi:hypothetical protein